MNTDIGGRRDHCLGHFRTLCPVRKMVQIVKLRHAGKTGAHHLGESLAGDNPHVRGRNMCSKPVHGFPPTPETVVAAGGFPETGQGTLKTMTVGIRQAGKHQIAVGGSGCGIERLDKPRLIN